MNLWPMCSVSSRSGAIEDPPSRGDDAALIAPGSNKTRQQLEFLGCYSAWAGTSEDLLGAYTNLGSNYDS
ncbi:hypothetical protein TNCV_4414221 [Trichonephila clavipes]|uniref:Uncharacterized protein n=1 Tax=Trichonephila clavipes TaxID=2585209 RepID=A0A8X6S011_TRICX|nr:hypothetical protein TNCV_4414221 [Trichonephila clavipes]